MEGNAFENASLGSQKPKKRNCWKTCSASQKTCSHVSQSTVRYTDISMKSRNSIIYFALLLLQLVREIKTVRSIFCSTV